MSRQDWEIKETEPKFKIKGYFSPVSQMYQFGKIYIGLNVVAKEVCEPMKGVLAIPLPFITKNYSFIRFKKFIPGPNYGGYKIRTDQEIERFEMMREKYIDEKAMVSMINSILKVLYYVRDGPYEPNR